MKLEPFNLSDFSLFYPTGTVLHQWGCNAELWLPRHSGELCLSSLVPRFLALQSWTDTPMYHMRVRSLRKVFLILLGFTSNQYSWVWPLQKGSEKFLAASIHTIGATAVEFLQDRTIAFSHLPPINSRPSHLAPLFLGEEVKVGNGKASIESKEDCTCWKFEPSHSTLSHLCQTMPHAPNILHQSLFLIYTSWIRTERLWYYGKVFVMLGKWLRAPYHQ